MWLTATLATLIIPPADTFAQATPPVNITSDGTVSPTDNGFLLPAECSGNVNDPAQMEECKSALPNPNPEMQGVDASAAQLIDYAYTTKELDCLPDREVWGSCPNAPMPHKRTSLLSFSDLSPYLWASLRDPNEPARKYEGPYYRTPPGSQRDVHAMISALNNTSERFAGCTHQIEVPGSTTLSLKDEAKIVRLQLDNCTNQYILNGALYPAQKSNPKIPISERRCEAPVDISPAIVCQPLRMSAAVAQTNEYHVGTYLKHSWIRLKQTPTHKMPRKRGLGPFTGFVGKMMGVIRNATQMVEGLSDLSNLGDLVDVVVPDVNNMIAQVENSFNNIANNITNLPEQLKGQVGNLKNMVQNFPQAFQNLEGVTNNLTRMPDMFKGQMDGMVGALEGLPADLTKDFANLPQTLQQLPQTLNTVQNFSQNMGNLTNALGALDNMSGVLQGLPETFQNLPQNIQNLQGAGGQLGQLGGLVNSFSGIGNGLNNMGGTFDTLLSNPTIRKSLGMAGIPSGTLKQLGQQKGYDIIGTMGNQAITAGGVLLNIDQATNQILGEAGDASKALLAGEFGDVNFEQFGDAASQISNDINALNQINQQFQGNIGNLTDIVKDGASLRDAMDQIPGLQTAGGDLSNVANELNNIHKLSDLMNSPAMQQVMQMKNDVAMINNSMADLQNLGKLFANPQAQQILSGNLAAGFDVSSLANMSQSFSTLNTTLNLANMNQLTSVVNMTSDLGNVFSGAATRDLKNMTSQFTSAALGIQELNPINSTLNELDNLKETLTSSLTFGINFNMPDMNLIKDPDPRLPQGTIIVNELPPPPNFPDITLNTLAASPFEEILDPSHPFSPRWHFHANDRDYFSVWGAGYSKNTTDNVYCAGDAKENKIPVDILEFRRKRIEQGENMLYDGMWQRVMFNDLCYKNAGLMKNPCFTLVTKWKGVLPIPKKKGLPCWACFDLKGKTDNPPCATRYNQEKDKLKMVSFAKYLPSGTIPGTIPLVENHAYLGRFTPVNADPKYLAGLQAGYLIQGKLLQEKEPLCGTVRMGCKAACSIANLPAKTTAAKLCSDLRRPYPTMNKLKMRFHKQGDPRDELPSGVPEGLTHKDYFKNHMPYPLRWDTGTQITETTLSKLPATGTIEQPPMDTLGQYTAVVGVGREAILEYPDNPEDDPKLLRKDERCLIGGWGDNVSVGNIEVKTPDPVASWTELKLYQLRTMRTYHQVCLGRYDKLFKIGGTEDHALALAGGTYYEINKSCEISPNAINTASGTSTPEMEPNPIDNSAYNQSIRELYDQSVPVRKLHRNWPRAWRGYISDPGSVSASHTFPRFGGGGGNIVKGMNKAKPGDIILMPEGSSKDKRGLARLAYVNRVSLGPDCNKKGGCFVNVLERDFGKFPDICGNTDAWGIEANRNLYKPAKCPPP
jgi:hypothetical protein